MTVEGRRALVLSEMQRMSASPAPWVSIAAVAGWRQLLETGPLPDRYLESMPMASAILDLPWVRSDDALTEMLKAVMARDTAEKLDTDDWSFLTGGIIMGATMHIQRAMMDGCECRNCFHLAPRHAGGTCSVPGCTCGPGGWM